MLNVSKFLKMANEMMKIELSWLNENGFASTSDRERTKQLQCSECYG